MTETYLQERIRAVLCAKPGVRVWRNNVGVDLRAGVRYGIGVGSADLVGMVAVRAINGDDVHYTAGRFFALEIKTPHGRGPSDDQTAWLETVRRFGGFACVVRSIEDALAAVDRCFQGASQ